MSHSRRAVGGSAFRDDSSGFDSRVGEDLFAHATLCCLICPPMLGGCIPWEITHVVSELTAPRG